MIFMDEASRLRKLRRSALLDTESSPAFDTITRIASRHFAVPICLVSLVDDCRQWFKSSVGLDVRETPRSQAFCAHTIQSDELMIVPDATKDPRFANNPLVTGGLGIRFYAGAPLIHEGFALGSLCVIDKLPRTLNAEDQEVLRDLAALVVSHVELLHAIQHINPTTGLPNRAQFLKDAESAVATQTEQSLVLVEFLSPEEGFDQSQALGATFAEHLLGVISDIVDRHVGSRATIYHIGPTHFLFSLRESPEVPPVAATVAALIAELRAPIFCGAMPIVLRACAGVVPRPDKPGPEQLRMARAAVGDARGKSDGVSFYKPESDVAWRRAARLLRDIPVALHQEGAFRLMYQPRIDVVTGACTGVEALLRWNHPYLGPISPAEFIPIIEETSLIHGVTDWVINESFRQAGNWKREGLNLNVAINLAVDNLKELDLVDRLKAALRRTGTSAEMFEIEITEGAVLHNSADARKRLNELVYIGFRISIDDFGSGYSNLAYLQHLPAKLLKIDQSLISTVLESRGSNVIVQSTIAMAHNLGYRVAAEGVESADILNLLSGWGVDEIQGFYFSAPLEADLLPGWVKGRNGAGNTQSSSR